MIRRPSSVRRRRRRPPFSKIFFSETTWPIKAKFYTKHLWEGGTNVFINNPGHMTKMAATPIHGKNPSKFFFSRTTGPDFNETWHEASETRVLQCVYKLWPLNDLDLFYGNVNIGRQCIGMGKTFKMSFKVKVL